MKKIIEIVPYDPNWPHLYEKGAALIKEALQSSLKFYLKNGYIDMPFDDPACQVEAQQERRLEGDECGPPDIPVGKVL